MESVLTFSGVGVRLAQGDIFKEISFELKSRERVVLIGPSGQGKSVLLKVAAGLMKPTSGEVKREGSVSMAFQRNGLFDSLSVLGNLLFPLKEMAHPDPEKTAKDLLDSVGLLAHAHKKVSELSGGQQKRLSIARSLAVSPDLILYDDPTAGLDPVTSFEIGELIVQKQSELGHAILMVTSDLQVAFRLATRLGFLALGNLLAWGTAESFRHSDNPYVHQFVEGLETGPLSAL